MKKFKNTFGITGSTHAINHFAKLAVKEGWYHKSNTPSEYLIFWTDGTFHHLKNIDTAINISTIEGWHEALYLMKAILQETGLCEKCKHLSEIGGVTFEKEFICMVKFWEDRYCKIKEKVLTCDDFKSK